MPSKGFTLVELLIAIAIVAILAVVVILTLNPAQLLVQPRDSNKDRGCEYVEEGAP